MSYKFNACTHRGPSVQLLVCLCCLSANLSPVRISSQTAVLLESTLLREILNTCELSLSAHALPAHTFSMAAPVTHMVMRTFQDVFWKFPVSLSCLFLRLEVQKGKNKVKDFYISPFGAESFSEPPTLTAAGLIHMFGKLTSGHLEK